jgi:hypothetical protein
MKKTADDAAAGRALLQHFPATGVYVVPNPDGPDMEKLHTAGPIATVHIRTAGAPAMQPSMLLLGYLNYFVSCLVLAAVLNRVLPALTPYRCRVGISTMIGLIVAVFGSLGNPIWWSQPWPYHLVCALYDVLAWLIAGLILAKFIRPAEDAAPAAG